MIGCFFCIELFVGSIIDNFNKLRDDQGPTGSALTSDAQDRSDRERKIELAFLASRRNVKKWGPAFDIAEKPEFDSGIMLCIALNSLLMAASHVGQPTWFTNVVDVLNYVFAVIFTIEIVIKILAYGRQKYFEFYISW